MKGFSTLVVVSVISALAVLGSMYVRAARDLHYGEASWTLQGTTSKPGCPGQHVETVEVNDHVFFLGCYGARTP